MHVLLELINLLSIFNEDTLFSRPMTAFYNAMRKSGKPLRARVRKMILKHQSKLILSKKIPKKVSCG
jgi:hypothetical protein